MLPRRPIFTPSPSRSREVGSPTRQWSGISPFFRIQASTLAVPLTALASSSPVMRKLTDPPRRAAGGSDSAAAAKAAMAPFMSAAPRPQTCPSATSGKWRVRPIRFVPGRHHVGMAGKAKMRPAVAETGIEIVDILRARLRENAAEPCEIPPI